MASATGAGPTARVLPRPTYTRLDVGDALQTAKPATRTGDVTTISRPEAPGTSSSS